MTVLRLYLAIAMLKVARFLVVAGGSIVEREKERRL